MVRGITDEEKRLLRHISMWGSDGYPIHKLKRGWTWGGMFGVKGPPVVFKTKRECVASFEAFQQVLLDALAERI